MMGVGEGSRSSGSMLSRPNESMVLGRWAQSRVLLQSWALVLLAVAAAACKTVSGALEGEEAS